MAYSLSCGGEARRHDCCGRLAAKVPVRHSREVPQRRKHLLGQLADEVTKESNSGAALVFSALLRLAQSHVRAGVVDAAGHLAGIPTEFAGVSVRN